MPEAVLDPSTPTTPGADAPGAGGSIWSKIRPVVTHPVFIGTVLLMLAAVALWTVGPQELAYVYAALVAIDTVMLLWIDTHR